MAIGLSSDFKIYNEYLHTRINEMLAQNGNVFNGASNGAISLTTQSLRGDFQYKSFFANLGAAMASRRDTTSMAAQTDTPLVQNETISVKLNRKINTVAQTRDAFRKIFGSFSQTEFTGLVAEQVAQIMQLEMLNTGLAAVSAAQKQQTTQYVTETSLGSISTNTLVSGLAAMGDRADRIVCWIMHSKPYYDLVKNQIAANITGVSNFNVAQGSPLSLGRPIIVTDSAALVSNLNSPDINDYYTLGLTQNAVVVENSEEQEVVTQDVTGLENLALRIQGEYAYNLSLKGFRWDVNNAASGGVNPTAAALTLGTNWDPVLTDAKNRTGVSIMTL
jgi:thiamine pyrophosphokinase